MRGPLLVLAVTVVVATAGCGIGGIGGAGDGELRRTTVRIDLDGRGQLELDLTADPPTIEPGYDDATPVPVTDLDAAAELRASVFDLPEPDPDCDLTVVPPLAVEAYVLPHPDVAERADLANHAFGGPCTDVDEQDVAEIVRLWNAAGGDLTR